jgi:conjugative transfer region protein TrbK
MSRSVKLAAAAAFGGMLATAAIVSATRPPAVSPVDVTVPDEPGPEPLADLGRCRTITEADPVCDAAWAARRSRFYGREEPK